MKFKLGIELNGIKAPMLFALGIIEEVYIEVANQEPTVTSALDDHEVGLHPRGLAVDVRIKDVLPVYWTRLAFQLKKRLNTHAGIILYDVVLETQTPGNEHIHIEYDPKLYS